MLDLFGSDDRYALVSVASGVGLAGPFALLIAGIVQLSRPAARDPRDPEV